MVPAAAAHGNRAALVKYGTIWWAGCEMMSVANSHAHTLRVQVRAWVIRKGYKAPQAAGTIHTDFEKGFICAEVMAFEDLKEHGTEGEVKAKGKYRQEGKGYVVNDADVIFFKFNVTTKGK